MQILVRVSYGFFEWQGVFPHPHRLSSLPLQHSRTIVRMCDLFNTAFNVLLRHIPLYIIDTARIVYSRVYVMIQCLSDSVHLSFHLSYRLSVYPSVCLSHLANAAVWWVGYCGLHRQAISSDCCTMCLQQVQPPFDSYPQQRGSQQRI